MTEAFRRGEDIHSRTAQEVFGVAPFAQTTEHRRAAKVINFGIIYGLSAFGLARNLNIDQKEAAKFINAYFERYSGVKAWLDRQVAERASAVPPARYSAASAPSRKSPLRNPASAISPNAPR